MLKFTIAGYYGFGNLGDEAVLASMVADFRERFPGVRFEILCASYQKTLQGEDIVPLPWTDWPRLIESIRGCDCLIVGGGGLFDCHLPYSDKDFLRPSGNLASLIFGLPVLAHLFGKICCIYAVGAGYFLSDVALEHARMAVHMADLCTVRDHGSRAIVSLEIPHQRPIAVHADPAFRLANCVLPERALDRAGIRWQDGPVVAVVPCNWQFNGGTGRWETTLAEALRTFAIQYGVRLLLIPFHANPDAASNDPALVGRMRERIGPGLAAALEPGLAPGEVSAIFARCEMVVAMRLHASILAIRNATPLVPIAYDPKVSRVLAECGLEYLVTPLPVNGPETLKERLASVWEGRAQMRQQLRSVAARMAEDAGRHVDLLAALLQEKPEPRTDDATHRFVTRMAGEQTQRLAIAETSLAQAEAEALSVRMSIRELVHSGAFEPSLRFLSSWQPAGADAQAEREYLLGFCLQSLGRDPEAALQHYTAALAGGFDEFWVRYHRGQLWFTLGRREEAVSDLTAACKLRPDQTDAVRLLDEWGNTLSHSHVGITKETE